MDKRIIFRMTAILFMILLVISLAAALEIKSGESEDLTIFLQNASNGAPLDSAVCYIDTWDSSGTKILDDGSMNSLGDGFYYFSTYTNWTQEGTYRLMAKCDVGDESYYSAMAFEIVGATIEEYLENINNTVSSTYDYLQNTLYPAIDETESKLDEVLNNNTNMWNKLVDIESDIAVNYNEIIDTQSQIDDVNDSLIAELDEQKNRLLAMNETMNRVLDNITDTINPNIDSIILDLDTIKDYTDTLESGQQIILSNLSAIQSDLDIIDSNTDQVEGYVDTLEDLLNCDGSVDTEICNKIDTIDSVVDTINSNTDSLESGQSTITDYVDSLESGQSSILSETDDLMEQLNCSVMVTSGICWRLNLIQGYTDSLESGQSTITDYVDSLESGQSSMQSDLDIIKDYTDNVESQLTNLQSDIYAWQLNATSRFDSIDSDLVNVINNVQSIIDSGVSLDAETNSTLYNILNIAYAANLTANNIENYLEGEVTGLLLEINQTTQQTQDTVDDINQTVDDIESVVEDINETVDDIEETVEQINDTVNENYGLLQGIDTSVNSISADTQDILSKWDSYDAQDIIDKTDSIETKVDLLQQWLDVFNETEQQRYSNIYNEVDQTEELLDLLREEVGFNGTGLSAYEYIVELESKLVSINSSITSKIEFESNRTISELMDSIQSNTSLILSEINSNGADISSILTNWDSYDAQDIIDEITSNRDEILGLEAWLYSFNQTEELRHDESKGLFDDISDWLDMFNTTENNRHQQTLSVLDGLLDEVNDTEELSNEIIAYLGYSGKSTTIYDDLIKLYNQNNHITQLAEEINLTTHQNYELLFTMNNTLSLVSSDTQEILSNWNGYELQDIVDKIDILDVQLDVVQQSSNNSDVLSAVSILQNTLNSTRNELGFQGKGITAYEYLVKLDSMIVDVNSTILNKIEFESNLTRQEIMDSIQNNVTFIADQITENENKIDSVLTKFGSYDVQDIIDDITLNRNNLIQTQAWLYAFNDTENTRHDESMSLLDNVLDFVGILNNSEIQRHEEIMNSLNTLYSEINDTEELSNEIIASLGFSGTSTTVYEEISGLSLQNTEILILLDEINLTTHSISDKIDNQIMPRLNIVSDNVTSLLYKWGSYDANQIYQQTIILENNLDNMQLWLDSFNESTSDDFAGINSKADQANFLLNSIREELGFNGTGSTAYGCLVELDNLINDVNNTLFIKIESEGNLTREHISSNMLDVVSEINENEVKLDSLLTNWGNHSAEEIINNVVENRNDLTTLQNWILALNESLENDSNEIMDYMQNTLLAEIDNTEELSNMIITQLGVDSLNITLYESINDLNQQNDYITTVVDILDTRTDLMNVQLQTMATQTSLMSTKVDLLSLNVGLLQLDVASIISRWGSFTMQDIDNKLDLMDTKIDNMAQDIVFNDSRILSSIANMELILNETRAEIGFNNTGRTAYSYFVELDSDLVTTEAMIEAKIETEHLDTIEQIIGALKSNTSAIISQVNDNELYLLEVLTNWGNHSAEDLMQNITNTRNDLIELQAFLSAVNKSQLEATQDNYDFLSDIFSFIQSDEGFAGVVDMINESITKIDETKALSNEIIADLGYEGSTSSVYNDTLASMDLMAYVISLVGATSSIDYVELDEGKNAIALPRQPSDTAVESVMANITGKYTRVDHYDSIDQEWKYYVPGAFVNTLDEIVTGKVYWIYANESVTLHIN